MDKRERDILEDWIWPIFSGVFMVALVLWLQTEKRYLLVIALVALWLRVVIRWRDAWGVVTSYQEKGEEK